MDEIRELAVREALFSHLDGLLAFSTDETLTWDQTATFDFHGEMIPIRQTRGGGINKPASLEGALSITTTFTPFGKEPPYDDFEGDDGHPRYKYQGTDPNLYTNRSLRVCMEYELPLVYFIAVLRRNLQAYLSSLRDRRQLQSTGGNSRIQSVRSRPRHVST